MIYDLLLLASFRNVPTAGEMSKVEVKESQDELLEETAEDSQHSKMIEMAPLIKA